MRSPLPRRLAIGLLAATALVAAGGCGGTSRPKPKPVTFRGGTIVNPPRAPDFALRDQSGRLVHLSSFAGKLRIVTFLYTHCPDVCPLIASNLNQALRTLGPRRSQVRVLAISVDPRGDTGAAVRRYARERRLLPEFHYLRGSARQLRPVWASYNIVSDPDRTDRAISHSAFEILIDRSGRERLFYDAKVTARAVVHDVRLLLGSS
jgi:protein SCO1/2